MPIDSNRPPGAAKPACSVRRRCSAAIATLAVALICLPALAADLKLLNTLPGKPRLANLEIEIWPEYDRPAALVLLKGELAAAGQAITLRLPVSSGGPSAVAQSSTADGKLLDLPYERIDAKDFITLRIQPPDRFFHVEYYDKLNTSKAQREYRYLWSGDLAVDRLGVHVQQPAAATGIAITPTFTENIPGNDTLIYWTKDMGAVPAGKTLPVTIRYSKSDARTSKELLGPVNSAPADAPAVPSIADTPPASDVAVPGTFDPRTDWIPAAIFALLGALGAGFMLWRWRRGSVKAATGVGFCVKCGNPLRADDRYCAKCGAAVSGREPV
jgi:hypothetical protein